jgi:prolyl-tRNA editing enzyme YbaK/EbsC (Cys-tRNA(Pro) deacylase)
MPDPQQCIEIYGYRPGAVPPLGLRTPGLPVYIDNSLCRYQIVYVSGGAPNALVPIALPKLAQATGGHFADVQRE